MPFEEDKIRDMREKGLEYEEFLKQEAKKEKERLKELKKTLKEIKKQKRKKYETRGVKVVKVMAYLIPILIIAYVFYMNFLPLGYHKSYSFSTNIIEEGVTTSKGIYLTGKVIDNSKACKDNSCQITLEPGETISFTLDPKNPIEKTAELGVKLDYQGGEPQVRLGNKAPFIPLNFKDSYKYALVENVNNVNVYVRDDYINEFQTERNQVINKINQKQENNKNYYDSPKYYFDTFFTPKDPPLLYYSFDSPPTNEVIVGDDSGNDFDGVLGVYRNGKSPQHTTEGYSGGAYNFSSGYIAVKDFNELTEQFTISTYVNNPRQGAYLGIITKGNSIRLLSPYDRYAIALNTEVSGNTVTKFGVENNIWHNLVTTYSGRELCLYIDNELFGCNLIKGEVKETNNNLLIGGRPEGYAFNGLIDEVKIYNQKIEPRVVLTNLEIKKENQTLITELHSVTEFQSNRDTLEVTIRNNGVEQTNITYFELNLEKER